MAKPYHETPEGLVLQLRVQPRASAERIDGVVEGRLRLRLTAPPVGNAANDAAIALVADWLGVPKSRITLIAGHHSREKRLLVTGDFVALRGRLESLLA